MPSALNAIMAARAILWAPRATWAKSSGVDVEDVARRRLRDHQRVAGRARHDVEKRQHVVVLVDLVAGELAAQDFCEDVVGVIGGHGGSSNLSDSRCGPAVKTARRLLRNGPASVSSRAGFGDIGALALEIVGDRAAQAGIGDVMRRIGGLRQISARDLVLALRAGLDGFQAAAGSRNRSPDSSRPRNAGTGDARSRPSGGRTACRSR